MAFVLLGSVQITLIATITVITVALPDAHSHHPPSGHAFALRVAAAVLFATALFAAPMRRTEKVKENAR